MYLSELNGADMSDQGIQGISNFNASLLRALETEQDAHQSTRLQLEQEINTRCEAEAETTRLAEHNKGLLNSIRLLQSTVKHMTQNENAPLAASKDFGSSVVRVENPRTETAKANDSILYDVLSNYKMAHKAAKDSEETTSPIDLDLLRTPDLKDNSEKAHLQRTLRRQMGLSSDFEKPLAQDAHSDMETTPLQQDLTEEHSEILQEKQDGTTLNGHSTVKNKQYHSAVNGHTTSDQDPPVVYQAQPRTLEQSVLAPRFVFSLPVAFLSKYGKKPAGITKKTGSTAEIEGLPPPQTPCKANLTVASIVEARDTADDRKPCSRVVYMPDSPVIDWKVDGRHVNELRGRYMETKFQSHFTNHPIRYGEQ